MHSLDENIQRITTSQTEKRQFAQNLEMTHPSEAIIFWILALIQERVMQERHTCWNSSAKGYVVPQNSANAFGNKGTYHCFAKQGPRYVAF